MEEWQFVVWQLWSLVIMAVAVYYAIFISAIRPSPAELTWFEVVVGFVLVGTGFVAFVVVLPGSKLLAIMSLAWAVAIGGGPMIVGQVVKHKIQRHDSRSTLEAIGRWLGLGNADATGEVAERDR
ncbi:MAG: hypothetical protein A2W25_12105 [candidate division Zixibacteria bacterium RBG_16_53_22]|nr:MAG: hypothetical protein A2W25_12105 [candidate division Zixibacteria bacterium RBG_16_53_22]